MDPRLDSSSVAMMNSELLNRLWLGMVSLILILSSGAVEGINFTFNSFESLSDVYTVPSGSQWSYSLSDSSLYLEPSINSVAGRFLYPHLVKMMDPETMTANAFSCHFIFQVLIPDGNGGHTDSGMTFMMVPDNKTVGAALDYVSPLTERGPNSNLHSFGVEFDTHMNPEFNDPNDNHVGIDKLRVMNSTATFIPLFRLAQGSPEDYHQAWIEYFQAPDCRMDLYISQYGQGKPTMPFSTFVDLSFLDGMYFEFSTAQSDIMYKRIVPHLTIPFLDSAPPAGTVRFIVGLFFGIVGSICYVIMYFCWRKHELLRGPSRPVRLFLAHSAGEDCAGKVVVSEQNDVMEAL